MVKYSKEFKEQALLLSDEIGVKKAAGDQLLYDCRLEKGEKPKGEGREKRIGQNAVERAECAMQREIQELKKARFDCGNQILLPQLTLIGNVRINMCAYLRPIEHLPKFTLCSDVQF